MPNDDVRNVYKQIPDRLVIRTADVYQQQNENGVHGYSDTLLSVVANFKNSGIPEGCNARSMCGKSKHGEVACQLFGVIDPTARTIERIGFKSRGCIAMTACSSQICTMAYGKTLDQALAITTDDLKDALDGVPSDKLYTLYFAIEALHALVGDYLLRTEGLAAAETHAPCSSSSVNCIMCEHCSLRDLLIDARIASA